MGLSRWVGDGENGNGRQHAIKLRGWWALETVGVFMNCKVADLHRNKAKASPQNGDKVDGGVASCAWDHRAVSRAQNGVCLGAVGNAAYVSVWGKRILGEQFMFVPVLRTIPLF